MGRIAPVVLLLLLAACASEPPPVPPRSIPLAPPAAKVAPPVRQAPPALVASGDYAQDVDDLFRALDEEDGRPARAQARAPGLPPRQVVYTIEPVSPDIAATLAAMDRQEDYEANLAACLDGELPAFCDPAKLSPADAARVQRAEFEANLVACIDPERQHLCRPELLPDVIELPDQRPRRWRPPARSAGPEPSATFQHYAPTTTASSPRATARPHAAATVPAAAGPIAVPSGPARPVQTRPPQETTSREPAAPDRTASIQAATLPASAIAQRLIAESIAAYPGRCPCPYIRDRAGRRCGARSAYNRPGGYAPLCFPRDLTPAMIEEFRARTPS